MWFTLFIVGGFIFIGVLAAVASWSQKRNPPRHDDHREVHGGTSQDPGHSGFGGFSS